ncbi:hypothetical protein OESDEN_17800 [Oesophagostomum dentatum]|uniref:Uncharacterized protein n=1 Tax=Oesophagostomum dentatum TaxID=61180 RepID=A0A0B1SF41_OESDE|nr:hypothetical protein OESDEN_17800 [Oesophagostomum dentatum]
MLNRRHSESVISYSASEDRGILNLHGYSYCFTMEFFLTESSEGTEAPAAEPVEAKTKNAASTPSKRASASSKPPAKRRQTQPHRRKAIDIEARKRELVEGIKKLGGTGTTRPIRRKVPYIPPSVGVRTSYRRSSSSSSETTTSSESWSSGSESEVDQE